MPAATTTWVGAQQLHYRAMHVVDAGNCCAPTHVVVAAGIAIVLRPSSSVLRTASEGMGTASESQEMASESPGLVSESSGLASESSGTPRQITGTPSRRRGRAPGANAGIAWQLAAAQETTRARDAALQALNRWMRDFRAIARIALADQPQRLEQLGVTGR